MNNTCIYTCVLWKTICIFCGVKLAKLAELLWVLTRDKSVANLRSLHSRFYLLPDSVVIWNKNFSIKTKVLHVEFFVVVVFSFFLFLEWRFGLTFWYLNLSIPNMMICYYGRKCRGKYQSLLLNNRMHWNGTKLN